MKRKKVGMWLLIGFILFGLVSVVMTAIARAAQDNDQPEFPTAVFLGDGPKTIEMELQKSYILKPQGGLKFELIPGEDQTYELSNGSRLWETTASSEPTILYQKTYEVGQVRSGCQMDFLIIDDDDDERINEFAIDGVVIAQVAQGMVVRGKFLSPTDGILTLVAADSVAVWFGQCFSPTPTPLPSLTPTATATATATTTPASQHGIVYIPMATGKNDPPPTPTPPPTTTPAPAPWIFTGTYADPHWWSGTFDASIVPFWQGVPSETWQTHWKEGRQFALIAHGEVIEFDICEYEVNVDVICAIFVNGVEIKTDLFEVKEVNLGEVYLFVGEDYCMGGPCLHVQTWWKQDPTALGLLVELFTQIERAKAASH